MSVMAKKKIEYETTKNAANDLNLYASAVNCAFLEFMEEKIKPVNVSRSIRPNL